MNDNNLEALEHKLPNSRYELLIDQYAQLIKLKNSASIKNGDPFNVDGVNFGLRYLPEMDPDAITICATVLDSKQKIDEKTVSWLLGANVQLHRDLEPVMAIAPVTQEVIIMLRVSLTRATSTSFNQTLKKMALNALEWRKKIADRKQTLKRLAV